VKVIVAGAGLGGLTAALSLHAAGIDVLGWSRVSHS
jgi:2-polyprenyl-6-methoxyphenol hydroxylase-like FAD-dependent oxidoreductase